MYFVPPNNNVFIYILLALGLHDVPYRLEAAAIKNLIERNCSLVHAAEQ